MVYSVLRYFTGISYDIDWRGLVYNWYADVCFRVSACWCCYRLSLIITVRPAIITVRHVY